MLSLPLPLAAEEDGHAHPAAESFTAEIDAVSGKPAETQAGTVVRLGLLDFESESSYLSRVEDIQSTVLEYLKRTTPGVIIEPKFYKTQELADAVRRREIEFFLGSSGFFVEMRPYGVRDIGTIVSSSFPDPNQCVAGVIFVRSDRSDLQSLEDLHGKTATSTDSRNFMTYQIGMGEIARQGFDPDHFFKRTLFTDSQPVEVVKNVLEGRADAGLLRACMLEAIEHRHPEWQGAFRVIGERRGPRADRLGCRYSTEMYPGWTFAVMPHTPPILTRHIAISLLSMNPASTASGFEVSFATDYARVNDLFRTLRIGPYAYLRDWTIERIVRAAWPWLLLAAGLAAAWVLHWLRLEKLVRRRTAALERAWARERAAEAEARETADKLDKLHCVSVVGELSSIFAHELGQPLSAMRYFARGLKTLSGKPDPDRSLMTACIDGLQTQITLAGQILERVRSYAKRGARRDETVDIARLAGEALSELQQTRRIVSDVHFDVRESAEVLGDPVELRIVARNLIKNADEAMRSDPLALGKPLCIAVRRLAGEGRAELTVENPGSLLDPETVASLGQPRQSSKSEGLGLGLMICRSIAEAHRAKLVFEGRDAAAGGGLRVTLSLPLKEAKSPAVPGDANAEPGNDAEELQKPEKE